MHADNEALCESTQILPECVWLHSTCKIEVTHKLRVTTLGIVLLESDDFSLEVEKCDNITTLKKVEVWIQEIHGINYYIDSNNNVYRPEDIITNKESPSVIAKWKLDQDNNYCIPEFKT